MNNKNSQILSSSQILQQINDQIQQIVNLPTIFDVVKTVRLHKDNLQIFKQYHFILQYKDKFLIFISHGTQIQI